MTGPPADANIVLSISGLDLSGSEDRCNPHSGRPTPSSADADKFLRSIERTLLFSIEWMELLSGVPQSLVHMRECFLAAPTTSNISIRIGSVPGLSHSSLISNLLDVSDSGVAAFKLAQRRMYDMTEISDTINDLLDDIIRCIGRLPNAGHLRMLGTKLQGFFDFTTDATACATKAYDGLSDWEILIRTLRSAILDMPSAIPTAQPSAPPVVLPLAQPGLPELPRSTRG